MSTDEGMVGPAEFRSDIDGLRAIAILMVVGFHAGVPGFSGGFVGVDVFFVVSGYLITRILLKQSESQGVRPITFWGKRIRRLVPAMSLMLVVTLGLSTLVLSPAELHTTARSAGWASVYLSNIFFGRVGTDYFAAELDADIYLHTWSLGVEEQFYLVWPLLLIAAVATMSVSGARRRRVIAVLIGITAASLAFSIWLTPRGESLAFFGLLTRMWEFAAGGLLAALGARLRRSVPRARGALALVGLGLLTWATLSLSESVPYPGAVAVVPVVGTLLVVFAGNQPQEDAPNALSRTLSVRPLRWIGRMSYSWYLWHWPFMLLAVAYVSADTVPVKVSAGAVALVVAYFAHRLVENPLRYNRRLVRSSARTYAMGASATALVGVVAIGTTLLANGRLDQSPHRELAAETETFQSFKSGVCGNEESSDDSGLPCIFGDADGRHTVLLVGDSHARQWASAFSEAADQIGVRVVLRWKASCPATRVKVRQAPGCDEFRQTTDRIMQQERVEAVVIAQANLYPATKRVVNRQGEVVEGGEAVALWIDGLRTTVGNLRADELRVGLIIDNPYLDFNPSHCIGRRGEFEPCTPTRAEALAQTIESRTAEEAAVRELGNIPSLSPTEVICDSSECALQIDGDFVFVDDHHLTQSFTRRQVPAIQELLLQLIGAT